MGAGRLAESAFVSGVGVEGWAGGARLVLSSAGDGAAAGAGRRAALGRKRLVPAATAQRLAAHAASGAGVGGARASAGEDAARAFEPRLRLGAKAESGVHASRRERSRAVFDSRRR